MNFYRFWAAVIFFLAQNNYFGWHGHAQSDAELIADGISLLLLSLSFTGSKVTINVKTETKVIGDE